MRVADARDRFGPLQRGSLAIGEERRLAPRVEPGKVLTQPAELPLYAPASSFADDVLTISL
jgi:hypothetical protein